MTTPKFEIKKFKVNRGHEGTGFYCHLWVDGVRGAEVIDEGNGGSCHWYWFDQGARKKFEAHVAAQPERPYGNGMEGTCKPDADEVIAGIIDEQEIRKKWARACKTKTLFRLKADKPEEYRVMKAPFTDGLALQLRTKHQDNLLEIINETLNIPQLTT
jgi:hypothetical protein